MKKITTRALSVLLIASLVLGGVLVYLLRYIDHGEEWALAFAMANSGATGTLTDRKGTVLASFDAVSNRYAEDEQTRVACYHVTGDFWGRTGSGALTQFWDQMHSYSLLTGTTHAASKELRLTVDADLCRLAYEALDGRNGAVLLMNYKTGELPVMVSGPSIDPLYTGEEVPDGAYINRCLAASFTPGSVFKLVTAAAAIETIPDLDSRSFFCEHEYEIAGVTITCSGTHGWQSFEQALSNSCNAAFAQITVKVGQESMLEHVRAYGFLDRHSLSGISTAAGSYPTDFVGDPELAWSGIGQSTDLVCPYSLLRYVAAIANGGVLVEPRLLSDEEPTQTRLLREDTAERLAGMMNYCVVAHYGGEERFPGLRLCAKTGTAELGDGTSHAWFAGFLSDEEHPYAFVVLVERGGSGLGAASPIANAVLQAAVAQG